MRIGVDARPLANRLNGIGRYTHKLLSEMIPKGHSWFLYSSHPLDAVFRDCSNVSFREGSHSVASPAGILHSQSVYASWAKRDQLDVFWSPRHHLPLLLTPTISQVVTVHDLVWQRFPETMPSGARALERVLMPASLKRADRIICVSQFTLAEIAATKPGVADKCRVIYSGSFTAQELAPQTAAPDSLTDDLWTADSSYVLSVGTQEPRKNFPALIEAFGLLKRQKNIPEKLLIVGAKGWGQLDLPSLIESLGLQEQVFIADRVSDVQLHTLYQGAKCLALPSLYEGFGLPLVEAMHFGRPLVVSKGTALEEIAGPAGISCDPRSVDDIARALGMVLTDQATAERLAQNALKRAALFNWETAATDVINVLQESVER